jgi:hypothetical protein
MANEDKYFDVDRAGYYPGGIETPYPDHNMASEYLASGVPFVFYKEVSDPGENSIITITFPYVTRWVSISITNSATTRLGFGDVSSTKGVQGSNYILPAHLTAANGGPFELKCKRLKIYVPNGQAPKISIIAGLTNVRDFPPVETTADITGITQEAAVTKTATKAGTEAIYSIAAS